MSDYDADILVWSERQGELLRRRAAGELVNDTDLDWPNIAEEIEALGRSERSALRSYIATVLEHLIKLITITNNHHTNISFLAALTTHLCRRGWCCGPAR